MKLFLSHVNSVDFSIYQHRNHSVSHAMERDKLIQESYVVGQYQVRSESHIPFISQCPSQQDNTTYIKVAQSMLELNQARTQDSQFCPDVQIRDSSQWEKHDDQRVICPCHGSEHLVYRKSWDQTAICPILPPVRGVQGGGDPHLASMTVDIRWKEVLEIQQTVDPGQQYLQQLLTVECNQRGGQQVSLAAYPSQQARRSIGPRELVTTRWCR